MPGEEGTGRCRPRAPGIGAGAGEGTGLEACGDRMELGLWEWPCPSTGWEMGVSALSAGPLGTGRIGNDRMVASAGFLTEVCVSLQWTRGLPGSSAIDWERGRGG